MIDSFVDSYINERETIVINEPDPEDPEIREPVPENPEGQEPDYAQIVSDIIARYGEPEPDPNGGEPAVEVFKPEIKPDEVEYDPEKGGKVDTRKIE